MKNQSKNLSQDNDEQELLSWKYAVRCACIDNGVRIDPDLDAYQLLDRLLKALTNTI